MKKILLFSAVLFLITASVSAQVIYSQVFGASSPAGWSQQMAFVSDPNNLGWNFDTIPNTDALRGAVPSHGQYAWVDDWDNNKSPVYQNYDSLYMPVQNLSSYSHVFMSFDLWFDGYWVSAPGDADFGTLAVSTNSGASWTSVYTFPANYQSTWITQTVDLTAY